VSQSALQFRDLALTFLRSSDHNEIAYLTGLPDTVRSLNVSHNL
jgi:hypothetical protein